MRVAEDELDVREAVERLAKRRLERAVELDRVHGPHALGEVRASSTPRPGADLEHDVVGAELREPADDAEDVLVDEEVLAELAVRVRRAQRLTAARTRAAAFASICALELARILAARLARAPRARAPRSRARSAGRGRAGARDTGSRSRRAAARAGTRAGAPTELASPSDR